jgi:hypothetical protein
MSFKTKAPKSKQQRYSKRMEISNRMKMHLRIVRLSKTTLNVVTLRPHTEVAYSTNYFHDTWHILSDRHGAQLLARLMWGLSFQRNLATVVMIQGENIRATPFGAERSDPILLRLENGPKLDTAQLRSLHRIQKRLTPSQRTIRGQTFGLDQAIERLQEKRRLGDYSLAPTEQWMYYDSSKSLWNAEQMRRRGGFVCYSAPAIIMRKTAERIAMLDPTTYGMDYEYIADRDGEVQIFNDYTERCSASKEARREVLSQNQSFQEPASLYARIAPRRDEILRRRREERSK